MANAKGATDLDDDGGGIARGGPVSRSIIAGDAASEAMVSMAKPSADISGVLEVVGQLRGANQTARQWRMVEATLGAERGLDSSTPALGGENACSTIDAALLTTGTDATSATPPRSSIRLQAR